MGCLPEDRASTPDAVKGRSSVLEAPEVALSKREIYLQTVDALERAMLIERLPLGTKEARYIGRPLSQDV